jgi:hypothetical protein
MEIVSEEDFKKSRKRLRTQKPKSIRKKSSRR